MPEAFAARPRDPAGGVASGSTLVDYERATFSVQRA
jgi:hypothetical protein